MARHFACPYLGGVVELTEERERHVVAAHPRDAGLILAYLGDVVAAPTTVLRRRENTNERLFAKLIDLPRGTTHIVCIVVTTRVPARHFIVTAYRARRIAGPESGWVGP